MSTVATSRGCRPQEENGRQTSGCGRNRERESLETQPLPSLCSVCIVLWANISSAFLLLLTKNRRVCIPPSPQLSAQPRRGPPSSPTQQCSGLVAAAPSALASATRCLAPILRGINIRPSFVAVFFVSGRAAGHSGARPLNHWPQLNRTRL